MTLSPLCFKNLVLFPLLQRTSDLTFNMYSLSSECSIPVQITLTTGNCNFGIEQLSTSSHYQVGKILVKYHINYQLKIPNNLSYLK